MQSKASSPQQYFDLLPEDRKAVLDALRKELLANLPKGFQEVMSYGMPSYVVPHELYPAGYHCKPEEPLPFMALASQKNHIAIYHMGMYANQTLMKWWLSEFAKYSDRKPDIGKSCIRFKNPKEIPIKLIGKLASKMTTKEWIVIYEKMLKR